MDRTIKYLNLTKPELVYEVSIRGVEPKDRVEDLRSQIIKLVSNYPADEVLDSCYEVEIDLTEIKQTLCKVGCNLDSLEQRFSKPLFERTKTYLNHVFYRVERIHKPVIPELSQAYTQVDKLFAEYLVRFDKFVSQSEVPKFVTVDPPSVKIANSDSDVDCPLVQPLKSDAIKVICDRNSSTEILKNKFDGKSCVRAFITRVEELRKARGVADSKMLCLAPEFLIGDALHWFRSVKDGISSWSDLLECMREDFDVFDFDYRLMAEIRARSQGEDENITIYLAIMHGMFARLSKVVPESERLELILHNIRPCYAGVLANCSYISTIGELREVCKNFERINARYANFKEPSNCNSSLAPEFNYVPKKDVKNKFTNRVASLGQNKFQCFKCGEKGHTVNTCPKCKGGSSSSFKSPYRCYRCGLQGYTITNCPKCSPNKATDSIKEVTTENKASSSKN